LAQLGALMLDGRHYERGLNVSNTYTVSNLKTQVTAESPEHAACCAVAQAYYDQKIPNQVSVTVQGHGTYLVKNSSSVEYDGGNVDAPIDVSNLSAERVDD
jgi:hypothetical protein